MFKLDQNVDTGDIFMQEKIFLEQYETADNLYEKVMNCHEDIMKKAIIKVFNNDVSFTKQDENKASYWPGRKPEDGEIDLNGSVYDAEKLVRSVTRPYPGAFIYEANYKRIIWKSRVVKDYKSKNVIEFSDGYLEILESSIQNDD